MIPTIGRIVHYQTDQRGGERYVLPAIITGTHGSHPQGGEAPGSEGWVAYDHPGNPVPVPNTMDGFVHLRVFSPGPAGAYTELTVPFDDSDDPAPRTWRWPVRSAS